MGKFIVEPHFRLQEWVAEEKGYFRAEGLDYEFRELIRSTAGPTSPRARGAPSRASRRAARPTSAAPATGRSRRLPRPCTDGSATSIRSSPAGIFVPRDLPIQGPEEIPPDTPISVGFQSGSHYATIQAL